MNPNRAFQCANVKSKVMDSIISQPTTITHLNCLQYTNENEHVLQMLDQLNKY